MGRGNDQKSLEICEGREEDSVVEHSVHRKIIIH